MHAPLSLTRSRRTAVACFVIAAGFAAAAGCSTDTAGTAGDDGGATDEGGASSSGGSSGGSSSSGGTPDAGTPPGGCTKGSECPSGVCNVAQKTCALPACTDGAKNAAETDVDCGGGACAKCGADKTCGAAGDCESGVCQDKGQGMRCQAPVCTDTVVNAAETDVDCGGTTCAKCADGKKCKVRGDCTSDVCVNGVCAVASCNDGAKNGTDTDVDCGGPACPRCGDNLKCAVADDCTSGVCADVAGELRCLPPTPNDQVKNGGETDVDCGGPNAPACAVGKVCAAGTDCASGGCNDLKLCAAGRSCTTEYGGRTCGLGGAGGVGAAQWEDCCATAPVTAGGVTVQLDKYEVTAGRYRVFLEDVGYNVRAFVQAARAAGRIPVIPGNPGGLNRTVLEPDWDLFLPTSFDGDQGAGEIEWCAQADCLPFNPNISNNTRNCTCTNPQRGTFTSVARHIGGYIFGGNAQAQTGCYVGAPGTHAFRFPAGKQDGAAPSFDQNVYDTKAMNCLDYVSAQAFCIWDGGRLESLPEWQAAYGAATLPWGTTPTLNTTQNRSETYWACRFPWATDATYPGFCPAYAAGSIDYADYRYSYEYPKLVGAGTDYLPFVAIPGRTLGRGPAGHADIVGSHYEHTSSLTFTATYAASGNSAIQASDRWSGNGSWEVHNYSKGGAGNDSLINKYGKLGLRCAHP